MQPPKTVPDNIWKAAQIIAEALKRKNARKLDVSAGERFGKAVTSTMQKGGYDDGQ